MNIPESDASLPDAADMLDASTVFFRPSASGKATMQEMALPGRAYAEIVHLLANHGLHGAVRLPKAETAARSLLAGLTARLGALAAKANELARSRTSDEKRAADLARLLEFWLIHGRPARKTKPE